jgi:TolB-like protein
LKTSSRSRYRGEIQRISPDIAMPKRNDSAAIPAREVRRQLQRILASRPFAQTKRMSRFLRFTVEQTLAGHSGELKEFTIGLEVFDRGSGYDPGTDPIVRVEARRLRSKLSEYYKGEGRQDKVLIRFPKGGYAPVFEPRLPAAQAAVEEAPEQTVAVLPFANLSAEEENEYFSDGLTGELIHALTKVSGLRVVAWSSAARMKGEALDIYEMARRLRVRYLIEGSVRQAGGRVRITAQLIDAATGHYKWSEKYDRKMEDLLSVQDEIAPAIASVLRVRLTKSPAVTAPRSGGNMEAYDHYLKGRFHWNKRTEEGIQKGIEHFEQAIAADPEFALGYAGLSEACSVLVDYGIEAPQEAMRRAKAAALRALELDPALGEAHTSLAFIMGLHEWRWAEAGASYRRALELNPGYATAHHWYGCDHLALLGRFDEAIEEIRIARQLDPLSAIVHEGEAYVRMLARRYEEAERGYLELVELDPHFYKTYTGLGRLYTIMGRFEQAVELYGRGRKLAGDIPSILGALGQTYGLWGKQEKARAILAELGKAAKRRYVNSTCFALVHLGLGEKREAMQWLETGCARREVAIASLKVHPAYDGLRTEPGFEELLRRVGVG